MRCSRRCIGDVASMEMPLTMDEPMPLSCFPVVEDDVPPSPTPEPQPPSLLAGTFFQQGFLDCAQEAVRFLTEDEGMAQDNPVVAGLKQHLVHATPAIPQHTSTPVHTSSMFTFSHTDSASMIRNKLHTLGNAHTRSSTCAGLSRTQTGSVRFSPYTVTQTSHVARGCLRRDIEKSGCSALISQRDSVSPISVKCMESVLENDVISTDDLQGVLKCLQAVQSVEQSQYDCILPSSVPSSSLTSSSSSCQLPMPPCTFTSTQQSGTCIQECTTLHSNSLDDSGVSVTSVVDMMDEVDGEICGDPTTVRSQHTESAQIPSALTHSFADKGDKILDTENLQNTISKDHRTCEVSYSVHQDNDIPSHVLTDPSLPFSYAISSPSTSVTEEIGCTSMAMSVDSNPSSQLSLLSSLSSGSHRLTHESDQGNATASKIQSLANQILLLLQEEADAGDISNSDDLSDDGIDSDSEEDASSDEDDTSLEAEP